MKKKLSSNLYFVLMTVLIVVFSFSTWKLISGLKNYNDDKKAYEELEQFVSVSDEIADEVQQEEGFQLPSVDFDSLMQINKDCIGWIYVPDTNISYPVVHTTNNDYYLYRLFNKKYGISGTIFLDARNDSDLEQRHSILYGHHMKNGTMFANAEDYKDQLYADDHPVGYYITPKKAYEIIFFAGYLTDAYNDSWEISFTDAEFVDWIERSKQRSHFYTDVTPTIDDRIITLSTCSYDITDGRFVLLGILKEME